MYIYRLIFLYSFFLWYISILIFFVILLNKSANNSAQANKKKDHWLLTGWLMVYISQLSGNLESRMQEAKMN